MNKESQTIDRKIRLPIALTIVLIGIITNFLVDIIAEGEFSQQAGYHNWKPYGILTIYYPMLLTLFRWLVPALGIGTVVIAARSQISTEHFIWSLCTFAIVAATCIGIGIFMVYGLYSVTHHVLGG